MPVSARPEGTHKPSKRSSIVSHDADCSRKLTSLRQHLDTPSPNTMRIFFKSVVRRTCEEM
jgi:hypothetical protein